ncbi:ADP-heptose:LPS heptosyltransferase [Hyphomicrobium sp. 1Nfss2.1]|uniref:glycosyltransferase family 9 protein n=1 Tax=Hyphomicrobium sp. 1Nfss2.1 TaxID=3413936 RepID=UPI003C7C9EA9
MEDPDFARIARLLKRIVRIFVPRGSRLEQLLRSRVLPALRSSRPGRAFEGGTFSATTVLITNPPLPRRDGRIVLLSLAHIGDFVLTLRAISALRSSFPDASFSLVCGSWNIGWARTLGWFDEVIPFNFFTELNRNWNGPASDALSSFEQLMQGKSYDMAIDLRHDADTRPLLYRIDADFRAGFYAPSEPGMPGVDIMLPSFENIDGNGRSIHAETRLMALSEAVIAAFSSRSEHPIHGLLTDSTSRHISPYAVLSIGAGDPIRQWPIDYFRELASGITEAFDLDIVILGGRAEESLARELAQLLPAATTHMAIGVPLERLPDIVSRSAAFVGHGSGTTHLAAALGVPTVAILSGVSRIDIWRPVGRHAVSLTGQTKCAPCGLRQPEDCPFGVGCMSAITPAHVLEQIEVMLRTQPRVAVQNRSDVPRLLESFAQ